MSDEPEKRRWKKPLKEAPRSERSLTELIDVKKGRNRTRIFAQLAEPAIERPIR